MRLQDLATAISAELEGDPELEVNACATLDDATPGQVSFIASAKYASKLGETKASAVIVSPNTRRPANSGVALLKAKDPYYGFRNAIIALHGNRKHPSPADPNATQSSALHPHSSIHPLAYVHPTATVGSGTVIYPFVYVGPHARVGADCILYPSVTIYDHCIIGDRVILHAGTSIGHDGFGHATHALPGQPPAHHKIPQSGIAIIEDDVEMGANCSIDRATVGATVIGKGTKFSNNVVIGHGSKVGQHNLFVAQVGLAGSVTTGNYVAMGGQAGVAGHLKIGHQVQIGAQSGVMEDIEDKAIHIGSPSMPGMHAKRVLNHLVNFDEIVKRIRELEKQVAEMQSAKP